MLCRLSIVCGQSGLLVREDSELFSDHRNEKERLRPSQIKSNFKFSDFLYELGVY